MRVTGNIIDVAVVAGIPPIQMFVETIKPVGCSGEIDDFFAWDRMGYKDRDGMADKHITSLDVAP